MILKDVLWDLKANVAAIVEGEPVGWCDETLKRVPVVNGLPRPDLRNKSRNKIARIVYQEALQTRVSTPPKIEFRALSINRRVLTRMK